MAETGKTNGDGGSLAGRAADRNRAAMFFDDLLNRGETETDTGPLRSEKWLKDFVDDLRRNGSSVVLNEDLILYAAPCAVLSNLNMEMPTGVHRFTRVPENTEKNLLELGLVAADRCDHRGIILGHLYPGDFEVGCDNRERALDHFGNAEEATSQFERFCKIQNLVQDCFDSDQIAHGILDACLRVEVEDAFTSDFLQLGANRGERLTHFGGQKHAELADRRLPLLLSDDGLRRTWSDRCPGGSC